MANTRATRNPAPNLAPSSATAGSGTSGSKASFITIDPVTRIEGHLKISVQIDTVGGVQQVVDAWSTGTLFRGVETILLQRSPWDAVPVTQRICGVCPVSHGMAASLTLDAAAGVTPPRNGRIMRNLVLGANFIQSHMLHFYHLALLDFVKAPDVPPWWPEWNSDKRIDAASNKRLIGNYVAALEKIRNAHSLGAVFGGRMPHTPVFIPGGVTSLPSASRIAAVDAYLDDLIPFIRDVWIPDLQFLGSVYSDYFSIGAGPKNLLAYGVFDLDNSGTNKLLSRGRIENGSTSVLPVDVNEITEDVTQSWYANSTNGLRPDSGRTTPQFPKTDGYSWLKAPRYSSEPYQVGPLARMWVNGDYRNGISIMDRHEARAREALKVAQAMKTWLTELQLGQAAYKANPVPASATAHGLTEAPRGALGHWLKIVSSRISHYQIVTPTCWNASPRDSRNVPGPVEQALIGTPVGDLKKPIELLRVVHSFDPCLSCAVHVTRPGEDAEVVVRSR